MKQVSIESKNATIQQLQTALAVNGLNTFSLKKRAFILAEQLDNTLPTLHRLDLKEAEYFMLFNDRFVDRRIPV